MAFIDFFILYFASEYFLHKVTNNSKFFVGLDWFFCFNPYWVNSKYVVGATFLKYLLILYHYILFLKYLI